MATQEQKETQSEYWVLEGERLWSKSDKTIKSAMNTLTYMDKAIKISPMNHRAWANKGFLLKQMGELDSALMCLNRAISLKSDYVTPWYNKGVIFALMGKFDDAVNCYNETLKLDPNHEYAKRDRETILKLKTQT